jgi:hypothetical protein
VAREQRDDAVRFAQFLRPQHYPIVPVSLHLSIVPHGAPWTDQTMIMKIS